MCIRDRNKCVKLIWCFHFVWCILWCLCSNLLICALLMYNRRCRIICFLLCSESRALIIWFHYVLFILIDRLDIDAHGLCLRTSLLVQFMEYLERHLYNAVEGCAVAMAPLPKVSVSYYRIMDECCGKNPLDFVVQTTQTGQMTAILEFCYSKVQVLQFPGHQISWGSEWLSTQFSPWASSALEAAKETKFGTKVA